MAAVERKIERERERERLFISFLAFAGSLACHDMIMIDDDKKMITMYV